MRRVCKEIILSFLPADKVLADAKKAFQDVERSPYEKRKDTTKKKPFKKMVGFIDGMKEITVWV